ncbi:aminoglycoside phosphotransferase family protein [Eleftheria terrae]|uniref:aminoglycoside phosphotransferase family protein n=1 Tax=Eleftheria terrae TaxID=1597781 RepID=UPI00263BC067|nr:phosphotransferase [Eleftheria terrae]WKB50985.1 phosphotransferase [Eleftheria terrae]
MTLSAATSPAIAWADEQRRAAFERWLDRLAAYQVDPGSLRSASADASFRRYFRIDSAAGTRIIMDAPPSHEDCRPFVKVGRLLRDAGLNAPEILEWSEADGFMLLSDLGTTTYLAELNVGNAASLYGDATSALVRMQGIAAREQLPAYDRALLTRELQLFPEWYIGRHIGYVLSEDEQRLLQRSFELILDAALAQPAVLVHRDYHSRNLMVCPDSGNPGVIDFQDAVWGPITYDLASLLRDAYVEWEEEQQIDWAVRYWQKARKAGLPVSADFGEFWRDFEWMGLQRHLKVLGIFCRLYHRDGKDGYLKDLPLVWRYAHRVAARYNVLTPLAQLLERLAGEQREAGYTF